MAAESNSLEDPTVRGTERPEAERVAVPAPMAAPASNPEGVPPAAQPEHAPKREKRREPKVPADPRKQQGAPASPKSAGENPARAFAANDKIDVTVIVPILTGDGRVAEVVEALGAELDRLEKRWECILVFDGVRGPAWLEAQRLTAAEPDRVRPIAFQQAAGESMCLTAGFERARGAIIVTSPQYVQIDPFELSTMLRAIDEGADFVTPWRHPRIDPYLNRIQSALFNGLMRRILAMQLHDLNCYFRAFKRQVLEEVAIYGDQYRFLPAIASRQGFKVVEVKVRHLKEWGGTGFFGIGVYARRFLDILGVVFLSKFTLKPLRFFGTLGGIFLLLGAAMCGTLFVQHFVVDEPGPLISRSVFQVGLLSFVLGVQIIGFGLVGEIIIYTQARNLREYRIERIWESSTAKHDDDANGTAPKRDRRADRPPEGAGGEGGDS
jgi:hypothetical protein